MTETSGSRRSEQGGGQANTPKGVCSPLFARTPTNIVRQCSLFAKKSSPCQNRKWKRTTKRNVSERVKLDRVDFIEHCRRESELAPTIQLGYPVGARPERGPDVRTYFHQKHRRGEFGAYFPLHQLAV